MNDWIARNRNRLDHLLTLALVQVGVLLLLALLFRVFCVCISENRYRFAVCLPVLAFILRQSSGRLLVWFSCFSSLMVSRLDTRHHRGEPVCHRRVLRAG